MTSPEWAVHLPPDTPPTSVALLADGTLPGSWGRRWREDPGHKVVFDDRRGWLTAAQLEDETRAIAARFAAAGMEAGDRIVMSAAPSADLVLAHVAALRLGLTVIPVNGAYTEREFAYIVRDARPAGAVVDDQARADWIRAASQRDPVVTSPAVDLVQGPDVALDGVGPDDPALIGYTSGTTGAPKGAVLRHGNLLATAEALRLAWRWTPEDRLVLSLPLFHMHGLGVGVHGTLTAGAAIVLRPGSTPTTSSTRSRHTARRCSSGCRPCTPAWPRRLAFRSSPPYGWRCPGPRRCHRISGRPSPSRVGSSCWSGTA